MVWYYLWYGTEYLTYLCIIFHVLKTWSIIPTPSIPLGDGSSEQAPDLKGIVNQVLGAMGGSEGKTKYKRKT